MNQSTPAADAIHFAVGSAIFGEVRPEHIALIAELGFPGFEPYRSNIMSYVERPEALKDLLDQHNVILITCSNGGPGQAMNFIDPEQRQRTIDDHVAFARDFLTIFGCGHFKINMGARPAGGTSDDDLKALADALNDLGRRTADLGIRLAAHPHIWGPVERPEEIRHLLDWTDPAAVWFLPDTAQINLGGGDPVAFIDQYYDRIAAIHWKDSAASYRGFTGETPTREMHAQEILYKDLGAGGVDLEAIWNLLRERGSRHWITLDLDPPRPNEGEGSAEDKLRINLRYLTDTLQVPHL